MSVERIGARAAPDRTVPVQGVADAGNANVEVVLSLGRALGDADFVQLFRDDERWAAFTESVAALFEPDFVSANVLLGIETTNTGMEGLRSIWLDWLAPWASYRQGVERIVDCGDRVLALSSDFGRRAGGRQKVKVTAAFLFTVRNGRIVRCEGYPDRTEALKAVGLA
jgi:ketosteroid isomerase-like protein